MHEEFLRGTALALFRKLRNRESVKGEITLVIGKPVAKADERPIREAFDDYLAQGSPGWTQSKPSPRIGMFPSAKSTPRSKIRSQLPRLQCNKLFE